MGRALDDAALRIWIDLVRLGGYYTASGYRHHARHMSYADIAERMRSLADNGMVRAVRKDTLWAYGVTTKCKAPPGYEHLMTGEPA